MNDGPKNLTIRGVFVKYTLVPVEHAPVLVCYCWGQSSKKGTHTGSHLVTVTTLIENVLCVKNLLVSFVGSWRETTVRAINDLDQQPSPHYFTESAGVLALSFITKIW